MRMHVADARKRRWRVSGARPAGAQRPWNHSCSAISTPAAFMVAGSDSVTMATPSSDVGQRARRPTVTGIAAPVIAAD